MRWDDVAGRGSGDTATGAVRELAGSPDMASMALERYHDVLEHEKRRRGLNDRDARFLEINAEGSGGKSALLARLRTGRRAFVAPPPRALQYPWYDALESERPIELSIDAGRAEPSTITSLVDEQQAMRAGFQKLLGVPLPARQSIVIEQGTWRVAEIISPVSALVTHEDWDGLGFRWLLWREEVSARDSKQFISASYDESKRRITTVTELRNEIRWHEVNRATTMRMAVDPDFAASSGLVDELKVQPSRQCIKLMRALVRQRVTDGLTPWPREPEIEAVVAVKLAAKLRGSYRAAANGDLHCLVWLLARVAPIKLTDTLFI